MIAKFIGCCSIGSGHNTFTQYFAIVVFSFYIAYTDCILVEIYNPSILQEMQHVEKTRAKGIVK